MQSADSGPMQSWQLRVRKAEHGAIRRRWRWTSPGSWSWTPPRSRCIIWSKSGLHPVRADRSV